VNDGLIDSFHHNTWATHEVLRACRDLSPEQLDATAPGTYGSVIDTLRHLVRSEGGYCRRLTGEEPDWYRLPNAAPDLEELARRNDDLAARWERFLAQPFDAERIFVIPWHDGKDYDVPAGLVLSQALHHGHEHRTHVCTVLTTLGIPTPGLGLWEWGEATGRAKPREA
jgi:uncharacterized damage-inducible protein DinB